MNNWFILYMYQTRTFWWLRSTGTRVLFWLEARIFKTRYGAEEEKTNYQTFRHLLSATEKPVFVAVGFAILLQYIDLHLRPYYQMSGINIPDDGDYVTFLATISGIGGVFIGLYYAGISAVGSAIYAKVPNNVRDLLAQERFGSVYMRFLSFLTFLGMILVALRISGFPRVYLAVPLVTLCAGIGVIAFVKLGQRAFYLFDPTKLSYHIFEQLQHWLGMVRVGGFQWSNKSFQNHAYRQASTTLDTLETLADITAKESHLSGKPYVELSQYLLQFLLHYEHAKRSIPTDSAWYEQRYQHRDWYRTEDSRVAIAHQTGTTLQPDVTSNKEWVEGRVVPILKGCIAINLKKEKYSEVLRLFDYIDAYTKELAREGGVSRAFTLLEELTEVVLGQFTPNAGGDTIKVDVLEKLAVAERLSSLPISVSLGYRELLERLSGESLGKKLLSIQWDDAKSIYQQDFPAYCLARLEWFRPRLEFETKVDGRSVTPRWYQTEMIRQVESEQFALNTKALVERGSVFFKSAIARALSYNHPWLAAAILSREWEYWHKVGGQMQSWPSNWQSLSGDRRIEGLPWPQFELGALRSDRDKRKDELLRTMSQQNMLLALVSRPEGFPDYAGQFLHTSGEVAFDALLTNNIDLLRSVFEPYLLGCLLRFDNLRPKVTSFDWREQQDFKIAAAALLDVMDVSGYARLLADCHENEELWNVVAAAWNKYLAEKHDQSPVPLLVAAVAITEAAFEIPHRGVLRTTWKQKINGILLDVPRHEVYRRGSFGPDTVIDHGSALVRIFARSPHGTFRDGIDVFITFYLRKIDGTKYLDFGRKRRDLQESIEREERRMARKMDRERGGE